MNDRAWTLRQSSEPKKAEEAFVIVAHLAERHAQGAGAIGPGLPAVEGVRTFAARKWSYALAALPDARLVLIHPDTGVPLSWKWTDRVVVDRGSIPQRGEVVRLRSSGLDEELFDPKDGGSMLFADADHELLWSPGSAQAYVVDFDGCRVRATDLSSGLQPIAFDAPTEPFSCWRGEVFLTLDGAQIGSSAGRWSTKTRHFTPFPRALYGCALSLDGRWTACLEHLKPGSQGGPPVVHLRDLTTGKERVVSLGGPGGPGTEGGPGTLATDHALSFSSPPNVELWVTNYGTYEYSVPALALVKAWLAPPPRPTTGSVLAPETEDEVALRARLSAEVCHIGRFVLPRDHCETTR